MRAPRLLTSEMCCSVKPITTFVACICRTPEGNGRYRFEILSCQAGDQCNVAATIFLSESFCLFPL